MSMAISKNDTDPLWQHILEEARAMVQQEPALTSFAYSAIEKHQVPEGVLAAQIAKKLFSPHDDIDKQILQDTLYDSFMGDTKIRAAIRADIVAVMERDPACKQYLQPLLFLKGFQALQSYRAAHWLWHHEKKNMALYIQSRVSEVMAVDIHPAAQLGHGIMLDHATGLVIGETATVGNNCSLFHEVTLGGTGKEKTNRHPKVGHGVLISAGVKVLGNIKVGDCARIGAGSVVLEDVPANTTVVGAPAKIVGKSTCPDPIVDIRDFMPQAPTA